MKSEKDSEAQKSYNDNLHDGAKRKLYQYGRELRQASTNAEKILWEHLKNRKLYGLKFRRQHPLGNYVADFYCHEKKLVVELDGKIHLRKEVRENDKCKTIAFKESGIKVIQFTNEQVETQIDFVLNSIFKACNG